MTSLTLWEQWQAGQSSPPWAGAGRSAGSHGADMTARPFIMGLCPGSCEPASAEPWAAAAAAHVHGAALQPWRPLPELETHKSFPRGAGLGATCGASPEAAGSPSNVTQQPHSRPLSERNGEGHKEEAEITVH